MCHMPMDIYATGLTQRNKILSREILESMYSDHSAKNRKIPDQIFKQAPGNGNLISVVDFA